MVVAVGGAFVGGGMVATMGTGGGGGGGGGFEMAVAAAIGMSAALAAAAVTAVVTAGGGCGNVWGGMEGIGPASVQGPVPVEVLTAVGVVVAEVVDDWAVVRWIFFARGRHNRLLWYSSRTARNHSTDSDGFGLSSP